MKVAPWEWAVILAAAALAILLALAGCTNENRLAPTYARALHSVVDWSEETAKQAEQGKLSPHDMAEALRAQADAFKALEAVFTGAPPNREGGMKP